MSIIKTLEIENFKSIKHLKLDCKRINIFIGEPNTGKSNILETLSIFSFGGYNRYSNNLRNFIRFERTSNLFYDESLDEAVRIVLGDTNFSLALKQGRFEGQIYSRSALAANIVGDYDSMSFTGGQYEMLAPFKFYMFKVQTIFPLRESDFLLPPSGQNLMTLMLSHKDLRSFANDIFAKFGLRLGVRPQENRIEVVKQLEDIIVSYPYSLTSDTLQRTIFHLFAILSNKDSILVFEEPESHAFPYYTKYFAETIALDKDAKRNNQYFISTHNPYLLLPLLEKASVEDVAVFITYFEDYQTKTRPLTAEEMSEIMEMDVFSNLDRFLEKT